MSVDIDETATDIPPGAAAAAGSAPCGLALRDVTGLCRPGIATASGPRADDEPRPMSTFGGRGEPLQILPRSPHRPRAHIPPRYRGVRTAARFFVGRPAGHFPPTGAVRQKINHYLTAG